jgi:hypothetical protein
LCVSDDKRAMDEEQEYIVLVGPPQTWEEHLAELEEQEASESEPEDDED